MKLLLRAEGSGRFEISLVDRQEFYTLTFYPSLPVMKGLVFHLVLLVSCVGARDCSSEKSPVSRVVFDEEVAQFVILSGDYHSNSVDGDSGNDDRDNIFNITDDGSGRKLRGRGIARAIQSSMERRILTNATNRTIYYVRYCRCSRDNDVNYFCPLNAPQCIIPRDSTRTAWCVKLDPRSKFLRSSWPFVWLWNLIILSAMLSSKHGRLALMYPFSFCYWGLNLRYTNYVLLHRPNDANYYLRYHYRRNRSQDLSGPVVFPVGYDFDRFYAALRRLDEEPIAGREVGPSSLVLKTRVYETHTDDESMEEHDNCTICFAPLENGDRVGAFPCQHTFHAECLKVWLARRAVCPLCQRSDVVTLQYSDRPGAEDGRANPARQTSTEVVASVSAEEDAEELSDLPASPLGPTSEVPP